MSGVRKVTAVLVCTPLALVLAYAGLLAITAILSQLLAGFIDLSQASLSSFLSPQVLLGWRSPGGTGGILDAIFGGPGAPGGTVSRYVVFMVSAFVAGIAWFAMKSTWNWGFARQQEQSFNRGRT
jgi:hypothetical protein